MRTPLCYQQFNYAKLMKVPCNTKVVLKAAYKSNKRKVLSNVWRRSLRYEQQTLKFNMFQLLLFNSDVFIDRFYSYFNILDLNRDFTL